MLGKALTITLLLVSSLAANASIVDLGTITRDTDTGLEWLDVTETQGLSYNQVIAEMGDGGTYEGWRYAISSELDRLILNFGYVPQYNECPYGNSICDPLYISSGPIFSVTHISSSWDSLIEEMILTLGDTLDAGYDALNHNHDVAPTGAGHTIGILGSSTYTPGRLDTGVINDSETIFRLTGEQASDSRNSVSTIDSSMHPDTYNYFVGSFLVRPSAVPIPAAAWLFGSALIGLVGLKRKKQQ